MNRLAALKHEHEYFLPSHPKASGKATIYIEGYPSGDGKPMGETDFQIRQILTLNYQLQAVFGLEGQVYVGADSFVYYEEGAPSKCVAPNVYVVFGVDAIPARRSFYTWAEGAVPTVAFEFLSDSTARQDRSQKLILYLHEIGMQEYFIHQPEGTKSPEFRGWHRTASGEIAEIQSDARGGIFSETLNLWFIPEDQPDKVRLLRPHYPDGTPIPTYDEIKQERDRFERAAAEAEARAQSLESELKRLNQLLEQR